LHVHWWLGHVPREITGGAAGEVSGLVLGSADRLTGAPDPVRVDADSVITAIGFRAAAGDLVTALGGLTDEARGSGRIEPGLYLAGWARRGPRGTIPSQRNDARELAEVIAADLDPSHRKT